jgi:hypothetical protein
MPYDLNFSIKPLCQRRSNALEISQKTGTVGTLKAGVPQG